MSYSHSNLSSRYNSNQNERYDRYGPSQKDTSTKNQNRQASPVNASQVDIRNEHDRIIGQLYSASKKPLDSRTSTQLRIEASRWSFNDIKKYANTTNKINYFIANSILKNNKISIDFAERLFYHPMADDLDNICYLSFTNKLLNDNKFDEALKVLDLAIEKKLDSSELYRTIVNYAAKHNKYEEVKKYYHNAKAGQFFNDRLYNAFIKAAKEAKHFDDAFSYGQDAYNSKQENQSTRNILLDIAAEIQDSQKIMDLYNRSPLIQRDDFFYASFIKAATKCLIDYKIVHELYCEAVRVWKANLYVQNAYIDYLGSQNKFAEAKKIFCGLGDKSTPVSYENLILAALKTNHLEEAEKFYREGKQRNKISFELSEIKNRALMPANTFHISHANRTLIKERFTNFEKRLKEALNDKDLELAKTLFEKALNNEGENEEIICIAIKLIANAGEVETARSIFLKAQNENKATTSIYNTILSVEKKQPNPAYLRQFLNSAKESGCMDRITFAIAISIANNEREIENLLIEAKNCGQASSSVYGAAIDFIGTINLQRALELFEEGKITPNKADSENYLYGKIIEICGYHKRTEKAYSIYEEAIDKDIHDPQIYTKIVSILIEAGNINEAKKVADKAYRKKCESSQLYVKAIGACKQNKNYEWAKSFFLNAEEDKCLNLYVWNAMIDAAAICNRYDASKRYFNEIKKDADAITYCTLIKAAALSKEFDDAERFYHEGKAKWPRNYDLDASYMTVLGEQSRTEDLISLYRSLPNGVSQNILNNALEALVNIGDVTKLCEIFNEMSAYANTQAYTIMIDGVGRQGLASQAEFFFKQALEKGIVSPQLFGALIHTFIEQSQFEKAEEYFKLGESHGQVDTQLRNMMIDCKAKKNNFHEAKTIFEDLKARNQANHISYSTIIRSSGINGDFYAAENYFNEAPWINKPHSLYENILSAAQMCWKLSEAKKYFDLANRNQCITGNMYNTMMLVYAQEMNYDKLVQAFENCVRDKLDDTNTHAIFLTLAHRLNKTDEAFASFALAIRGKKLLSKFNSKLIVVLGSVGKFEEALSFFKSTDIKSRDAHIYSAIITAARMNRQLNYSSEFFKIAKQNNRATTVVYNTMLISVALQKNMQAIQDFYEEAKKKGLIKSSTKAALMRAYFITNSPQQAHNLFNEIKTECPEDLSVDLFKHYIKTLIKSGNTEAAICTLSDMPKYNLQPTAEVFSSIIYMLIYFEEREKLQGVFSLIPEGMFQQIITYTHGKYLSKVAAKNDLNESDTTPDDQLQMYWEMISVLTSELDVRRLKGNQTAAEILINLYSSGHFQIKSNSTLCEYFKENVLKENVLVDSFKPIEYINPDHEFFEKNKLELEKVNEEEEDFQEVKKDEDVVMQENANPSNEERMKKFIETYPLFTQKLFLFHVKRNETVKARKIFKTCIKAGINLDLNILDSYGKQCVIKEDLKGLWLAIQILLHKKFNFSDAFLRNIFKVYMTRHDSETVIKILEALITNNIKLTRKLKRSILKYFDEQGIENNDLLSQL